MNWRKIGWYSLLAVVMILFVWAQIAGSFGCTESELETIGSYVQGEKGEKGDTGATGASGNITTNTATSFSGIIVGDSGNCSEITQPSGTVVGTTDTQELTNKTLNAGSGSIPVNTTGNIKGIEITSTSGSSVGPALNMVHHSGTPANGDSCFQLTGRSYNVNSLEYTYGLIRITTPDISEGSSNGGFEIWLLDEEVLNQALILSSEGILYVDDSYDTFDEYDDAEVLREGISKGNKALLLSLGVIVEKRDDYGSIIPDEYMISTQRLINLIAGGVYQNRDYIESLEARIAELGARLK